MKIYIEGVGQRNTETESKEIIWIFQQKSKNMSKAQKTSYFLGLKERLTEKLIECEAFEILAFICEQVTTEQELRKKRAKARARVVSEIEAQDLVKRMDDYNRKQLMKKLIAEFNTPN